STPNIRGKSRMRAIRSYGSARGALGNRRPYRNSTNPCQRLPTTLLGATRIAYFQSITCLTGFFHGGNTGSNPVGDANKNNGLRSDRGSVPFMLRITSSPYYCPKMTSQNSHRFLLLPWLLLAFRKPSPLEGYNG